MIETSLRKAPWLTFVLSTPRAGVELLAAQFDGHAGMRWLIEPNVLLPITGVHDEDRLIAAPYNHGSALRALRGIVPDKGVSQAIAAYASTVYEVLGAETDSSMLVDSSPRYFNILGQIAELFPDAVQVWLRRNPLDVVASCKERLGVGPGELMGYPITPWSFDITVALPLLAEHFRTAGEGKHCLLYEDLVAAPQATLEKLCAFLRVPPPERNQALADPATQGPIRTWSERLTPDEVRVVVSTLGSELFERLGYEREFVRAARFAKLEISDIAPEGRLPQLRAAWQEYGQMNDAESVELADRRDVQQSHLWSVYRQALLQAQERLEALTRLSSQASAMRDDLDAKDRAIEEWRGLANDRQRTIAQLESQRAPAARALEAKERSIADMDAALQEKEAAIVEKEAAIVEKEAALQEKDGGIKELIVSLEEKEAVIRELAASAEEKERVIAELSAVQLQGQEASELRASLDDKEQIIEALQAGLDDKEQTIAELTTSIEEKERELAGLENDAQALDDLRRLADHRSEQVKDLQRQVKTLQTELRHVEDAAQVTTALDALHETVTQQRRSTEQLYGEVASGLEASRSATDELLNRTGQLHESLETRSWELQGMLEARLNRLDELYAQAAANADLLADVKLVHLERERAEFQAAADARLQVIEEQKQALEAYRRWHWRDRLRQTLSPQLGHFYQHDPHPRRIPGRYTRGEPPSAPPLISIVTTTFNQAEFVERTIHSVVDQAYPKLQYIVQDAQSTDGTLDILERCAEFLSGVDSEKDGGMADGLNRGFRRTSGQIMAYLNSDDLLLPGTLNYVARYFAAHPDVDVVYGHRIIVDEYDAEIGRWVLPKHDDNVLSWADYVPQETLFWRRELWQETGGYIDESYRFAVDWELLVRFREAGAKMVRLPRFMGAFRFHANQKTSAQLGDLGEQEMMRLRERCLGRPVDYPEINAAVRPYMARHLLLAKLYRLGLARY